MSLIRKILPAAALLLAAIPPQGVAAALNNVNAVPHLDRAGQDAYRDFLAAGKHRAFALAPGGVWTWNGGAPSAEAAAENALETCEFDHGQRCLLYALDDKVVFEPRAWAGMWGPHLDRAAADKAKTGLSRGERFPDLAFGDPSGKAMKLSDLHGKVVMLHFWGSWCPPCRHEMPELQRLHGEIGGASRIEMVLLQVREDITTARDWARKQKLRLPLHDSGVKKKEQDFLALANGKTIHDRYIAEVFPATYILDRHGIVVYVHHGALTRWKEYLPLLRDVAEHSGK